MAMPLTTGCSNQAMHVDGIGADQIGSDAQGQPTVLRLKPGQTATVRGLPSGRHRVVELDSDGFVTRYTVGSAPPTVTDDGQTSAFTLDTDLAVTFDNEVLADETAASAPRPASSRDADLADTGTGSVTGLLVTAALCAAAGALAVLTGRRVRGRQG